MTGRFTPTCVGTTVLLLAREAIALVHPHVRGDNLRRQLAATQARGSPPRAWGQHQPGPPR